MLLIFGALIFVFSNSESEMSDNFILGSSFLTIAIFIQSIQNLVVKKLSQNLNVIVISAFTASLSGLIYLLFAYKTDVIINLKNVSFEMIIYLILAGIYGMLTGMLMAFYIVKTQGIVVFNVIQLLVPVSTAFVSFITLNEIISFLQIFGILIIILGCYLSLKRE